MLNKAKLISKELVSKVFPKGNGVFYNFMENAIEKDSVSAVINIIVNEDGSVSVVADKKGVKVEKYISEKGVVQSVKETSVVISDDLKQKIDKTLYIVKELPMCGYLCVDTEGVYWGMSLVCDFLSLSKLGAFPTLIDNLDSKQWEVLNVVDNYFMDSNGWVGFVSGQSTTKYTKEGLVCEFSYSPNCDGNESALVYLTDKGLEVKLVVDEDFMDYVGADSSNYLYI